MVEGPFVSLIGCVAVLKEYVLRDDREVGEAYQREQQ